MRILNYLWVKLLVIGIMYGCCMLTFFEWVMWQRVALFWLCLLTYGLVIVALILPALGLLIVIPRQRAWYYHAITHTVVGLLVIEIIVVLVNLPLWSPDWGVLAEQPVPMSLLNTFLFVGSMLIYGALLEWYCFYQLWRRRSTKQIGAREKVNDK